MENYVVYNGALVPESELMHYGIIGMKWGIRRYQNPDGSLTEAGYKRYAKNHMTPEANSDLRSFSKSAARSTGTATAIAGTVGLLAGGVGGMVVSALGTAAINSGVHFLQKKKLKNMYVKEIVEQKKAEDKIDQANKAAQSKGYMDADHEKFMNGGTDNNATWNKLPSDMSFKDYTTKVLKTDTSKVDDPELVELMKMEYNEFKEYKKSNKSSQLPDATTESATKEDYKKYKVKPVSAATKENLDSLKSAGYNTEPSLYDVSNKRNTPVFATKDVSYKDPNGKTGKITFSLDLDGINSSDYASAVKTNATLIEKNISKIKSEFEKQLGSELDSLGYNKNLYKDVPRDVYVTDHFGEIGVSTNDGHQFSCYIDPTTGKLEHIMMNG